MDNKSIKKLLRNKKKTKEILKIRQKKPLTEIKNTPTSRRSSWKTTKTNANI